MLWPVVSLWSAPISFSTPAFPLFPSLSLQLEQQLPSSGAVLVIIWQHQLPGQSIYCSFSSYRSSYSDDGLLYIYPNGPMDQWSIGQLVRSSIGPLVHWFIVPLDHWSIGLSVHWSIGSLVHWTIGPLVHWSIGPLVNWLNVKSHLSNV